MSPVEFKKGPSLIQEINLPQLFHEMHQHNTKGIQTDLAIGLYPFNP